MTATHIIELAGVGVIYPGPPPVAALGPVDLAITEGEHVAIVGPSGSGKSTLLNVLGLLRQPTQGRYLLDGVDTSQLRESQLSALRGRSIGFVFQSFHLMPHRTAEDNVALAQLYRSTPRSRRMEDARTTLRLVGLGHRVAALPIQMSGGERQRTAIARALAGSPRLLLCDEPTGNLDSENANRILDILDHIHADGLTVIIITHDSTVAARASRVIALSDGQIADERQTERQDPGPRTDTRQPE